DGGGVASAWTRRARRLLGGGLVLPAGASRARAGSSLGVERRGNGRAPRGCGGPRNVRSPDAVIGAIAIRHVTTCRHPTATVRRSTGARRGRHADRTSCTQ